MFDTLHCIELQTTPWLNNSDYLYSLSLELTAHLGMCLLKTRYQRQEVNTKETKTGGTEKTRHYHCNDAFREISSTVEVKSSFISEKIYVIVINGQQKFLICTPVQINTGAFVIFSSR